MHIHLVVLECITATEFPQKNSTMGRTSKDKRVSRNKEIKETFFEQLQEWNQLAHNRCLFVSLCVQDIYYRRAKEMGYRGELIVPSICLELFFVRVSSNSN